MLDILVGALFLGAVAKLGIDKVSDVGHNIKENGFKDTMSKEIKNTAEFIGNNIESQYKSTVKEMEKREREKEKKLERLEQKDEF